MKLAFLFTLILSISISAADIVERQFNFRIKTANTDSVFQKIIEESVARGGYFTNYSESFLHIRIPVTILTEFESVLRKIVDIEDKSFSSIDKSTELATLNAQIKSRKKLLDTYIDMVKKAPFAELQAVEREMVNLNRQIESLQGRSQAIEKRTALASISIHAASIVSPVTRTTNAHSPFLWINSTDLGSLRRDF